MVQVHTQYGVGDVVATETVRGKTRVKVAGNGFTVWFDQTQVRTADMGGSSGYMGDTPQPSDGGGGGDLDPNFPFFTDMFEPDYSHIGDAYMYSDPSPWQEKGYSGGGSERGFGGASAHTSNKQAHPCFEPGANDWDNHTALPWNYQTQFPTDMWRYEGTISPDHHLDADKRAHEWSDSVSGKKTSPDRPSPGPNPKLFEKKQAGWWHDHTTHPGDEEPLEVHDSDEWLQLHPEHHEAHYRPAGLSDKYIRIDPVTKVAEHIARFRKDPLAEIQRQGHIHQASLTPQIEAYGRLVEADAQLRESAWVDVQAKAKRLKQEGKVHVKDYAPTRMAAVVDGDNGTYDVLLYKGAGYGGAGKGAGSIAYSCSCPWGSWAFNRKTKFGRLCSHGLAAMYVMQSLSRKGPFDKRAGWQHEPEKHHPQGPQGHPYGLEPEHDDEWLDRDPHEFNLHRGSVLDDYKKWVKDSDGQGVDTSSVANFVALHDDPPVAKDDVQTLYDYAQDHPNRKEKRDFDTPYEFRTADMLRTRPKSLVPELVFPEEDEDESGMTSLKDERKTTAPDQIMHFSNLMEDEGWALGPGGGTTIDRGFQGTGPDPKFWYGDSEDYVDRHEKPHREDFGDPKETQPKKGSTPDGMAMGDQSNTSGPMGAWNTPDQGQPEPMQVAANRWLYSDADSDPAGYHSLNNAPAGWDGSSPGDEGYLLPGMKDVVERMPRDDDDDDDSGPSIPKIPGVGKGMMGETAAGGELAEAAPFLAAATIRSLGRSRPPIVPDWQSPNHKTSKQAVPEDFGYDGETKVAAATDDDSDVVARFRQAAAAGQSAIDAPTTPQKDYGTNDFAAAAQGFLRTAGRNYSLAEQRELEAEHHPLGARNMPTEEELQGTHYV